MLTFVARVMAPLYTLVLIAAPSACAVLPLLLVEQFALRVFAAALIVPLFGLAFLLTACLLSRPLRWAVQEGRFERSASDPVYRWRRLHTTCWTAVYYSPAYSYYLSIGWLKWLLFRGFGYRGSLAFTCYPDTWIRDLPVLEIGRGAYLANKSTIGTNLATRDGRIRVEKITIGERAMIGHLTMVAAGTHVGRDAEISHGTACGARVKIGEYALVSPDCGIDHTVEIGTSARIGFRSYVGLAAKIGAHIDLPAGSNIPRRARLMNQSDVDDYVSSETRDLNRLREQLASFLQQGIVANDD